MAKEDFAPRLHVLFASASDGAVVLRRGPSKRVASFAWNRANDDIALGQWLKGRIYERRCDLSPDGRHLIYFAFNGKRKSETRGSWTAVARAPYLKALDLYAKGDCWQGGGLFLSNQRYWLNDMFLAEDLVLRHRSDLQTDQTWRPAQRFGNECTGVYYPRLLRDGWSLMERAEAGAWNACTTFDKPLAGGWVLRKFAMEQVDHPPGKGCYWDSHELRHTETLQLIPLPDWEWVEWDRGALVWAEGGKLFRSKIGVDGVLAPALIHDFGHYAFTPIEAPYNDDGDVITAVRAKKRAARKAKKARNR